MKIPEGWKLVPVEPTPEQFEAVLWIACSVGVEKPIRELRVSCHAHMEMYRDLGWIITPLYTHPTNDGLRKAAEKTDASLEALLYISDDGITHSELAKNIIAIRESLRAELDKNK